MEDLKFRFDLFCHKLRSLGAHSLFSDSVETIKLVGEAVAKPTVGSVSRAAMSVAALLSGGGLYSHNAMNSKHWTQPFPSCLMEQLVAVLEPRATLRVSLDNPNQALRAMNRADFQVAWTIDSNVPQALWASVDGSEAAFEYVRELLWETVNPRHVVLSSSAPDEDSMVPGSMRLATDDSVVGRPSQYAQEFAEYMKLCMEKNVHRTVLFHGPPGTGKSSLARMLCDLLDLRSLRFRVEDISYLDNTILLEMLTFVEPDVEIVPITRLDDAAVLKLLGPYTDAFDTVVGWPVAFINEYVTRRNLLGKERALGAMEELQKRVESLNE